MAKETRSFGILGVGLTPASLASAEAFSDRLPRTTRTKFTGNIFETAAEIVTKKCPYDCVLMHLRLPDAFFAPPTKANGIPEVEGLLPSECIMHAVLKANPKARVLMYVDPKDGPSPGHQRHFAAFESRMIYVVGQQLIWEDIFFQSGLFAADYEHLQLYASFEQAA